MCESLCASWWGWGGGKGYYFFDVLKLLRVRDERIVVGYAFFYLELLKWVNSLT